MRLRPYRLANCSLNAYVSVKWKPVSRKITGTVRSMRLSRCASTTPPPPKLTVRAAFPGNVSTAHKRVVSGWAPLRATARSRTCAALNMRRAPEVAELEETIDHAGDALSDLLAREAVRLRNTRIRYQLGLSHFPPTIPFVPPLRSAERGTGGEANKTGPLPWEAGPICVARAVYKLVEHHPMPATTAPQPRPLPVEQGHIIRQGGQQQVAVERAIMILLFTRQVPPCQSHVRAG